MSDMDHDWESNGLWPHDPEAELAKEHEFPCSCGDADCVGDDRDADNIRLGSAWYASDCLMGRTLQQIADGRELASRADVIRDDGRAR